jgi:hypothetical protein
MLGKASSSSILTKACRRARIIKISQKRKTSTTNKAKQTFETGKKPNIHTITAMTLTTILHNLKGSVREKLPGMVARAGSQVENEAIKSGASFNSRHSEKISLKPTNHPTMKRSKSVWDLLKLYVRSSYSAHFNCEVCSVFPVFSLFS